MSNCGRKNRDRWEESGASVRGTTFALFKRVLSEILSATPTEQVSA